MDRHSGKGPMALARDVVSEAHMAMVHLNLLTGVQAYYIKGMAVTPVIVKKAYLSAGRVVFDLSYRDNKHYCNAVALECLTFCSEHAIERVMTMTQDRQTAVIKLIMKAEGVLNDII